MIATIDELIEQLQEARDEMGGEAQVRVAFQQNYPLMGTLASVTVPSKPDNVPHCDEHITFIKGCPDCSGIMDQAVADGYDPDDAETHGSDTVDDVRRGQLWLAVGSAPYDENPYGPRWAWGEYDD